MRNGTARRRQPPKVLRTPIQASCGDSASIAQQVEERIQALFKYCGVDRSEPIKLIQHLARERFPSAFKFVPIGERRRTKNVKWTYPRRAQLVECIMRQVRQGISQEAAAKHYKDSHCQERGSEKGIVAEFYRSSRLLMFADLTIQEVREVNKALRETYSRMPQCKNSSGRYSYFVASRGRLGVVEWCKKRPPTEQEMLSIFGAKPVRDSTESRSREDNVVS